MTDQSSNEKNPAVSSKVLNTQIIPQATELVKFDPEADIERGQRAARALMKIVEITKPLKLGGKTYLYFEHWLAIAKFFNITVGTDHVIYDSDAGSYIATAVVYNRNGIIIGGAEASCSKKEKNWSVRRTKYGEERVPDFQLRSMAQTRAMAKALRSILGYIPVLAGIQATPAEEMDNEPLNDQPPRKTPNIASTSLPEPDVDVNTIVPGNPPVNRNVYKEFSDKVKNAKTIKEIDGYSENLKYLSRQLTPKERALLRSEFTARRLELDDSMFTIETTERSQSAPQNDTPKPNGK